MNQGQLCIPPRPGGGWIGREEGVCLGGRVGVSGGGFGVSGEGG